MRHVMGRFVLILGLAAAGLAWNGEIWPTPNRGVVATAEAVVGGPATPVSYAGVAGPPLGQERQVLVLRRRTEEDL